MSTTKNTGDKIDNEDVNPNTKSDAYTTKSRYQGLLNVWNNPDLVPLVTGPKLSKFPTVTDPYTAAGVPAPAAGDKIYASHINAAKDVVNAIRTDSINNLTGSTGYPTAVPAVSNPISKSAINNLITTLSSICSVYDNYNSYWDGSNLCARSCQVACQTACQTSCQGCNSGMCHNQKCGAH